MFPCSFCELVFNSIDTVIGHMKLFHPVNFGSGYKCKFSDCSRQYDSLPTFTKHLKRNHNLGGPFINNVPVVQIEAAVVADEPEVNDLNPLDGDLLNLDNEADQISEEALCKTFANAAIAFTSKLYSVNTMNRSDTDLIVKYSNQLIASIVLNLKRKVRREYGDGLDRLFDIAVNVFEGLETDSQRLKAFESSKAFVKPVPFTIDYVGEYHGNYEPILRQVPLVGQHVRMLDVLKLFFELPGVYDSVLNNYNSLINSESPVTNIVQGKLWKYHILPKFVRKTVLPLSVYFDDTEPNNALGSHATDHKLGCLYYTCPIIPQKFLAALKNIFVSSVVLCNDRNVLNGNKKVFRLSIEELKILETRGLQVNVNGQVKTVHFALAVVLGDNLGLNSILGFVESFTANFYCRFCKVHKHSAFHVTKIPQDLLRTVQNYAEDTLVNDQSLTGVFEECIFNSLESYHVILNGTVDVMHDILEGVAKYDLCKILFELIYVRKYFSLETLKDRVDDFGYGPLEAGNRPPSNKISRDSLAEENLNFSSAEMLCFLRYLGEMIADLVPENDPVWELYILLRQIIDILFAPQFVPGTEKLLHVLIVEHHSLYIDLFHCNLKPKYHFMLHYCHLMEMLGPLLHLSSIRWEGKHRELKQVARATNSRINLPFTIVLKHQLRLCYRFLSGDGLKVEFSVGSTQLVLRETVDPQGLLTNFIPNANILVNVANWVTVCGVYFKVDMLLHVAFLENMPCFSKITQIIYDGIDRFDNPKIYFICKGLVTECFNHHRHAYRVSESDVVSVVPYDDILSPYPLLVRGGNFVTTRYTL